MITLMPELIDGAVVCSLTEICQEDLSSCGVCQDNAIYIHNWLQTTGLQYLILDLQEEKNICPGFIEALLHLKKRLPHPFLFAGVVEKPKQILARYAYSDFPFFVSPEDAVRALRVAYPGITEEVEEEKVQVGEVLGYVRAREGSIAGEVAEEAEA